MDGPNETPGGSGKDDQTNLDDPLYVHPSDNVDTTIVTTKLSGNENFTLWRSSMSRSLRARNKLGFVDGTLKKNDVDEIKNSKWDRTNVVVCSWLLSSIYGSIYHSHAYWNVAKDIWKNIFETYNKSKGSVVFNIHQQINSFKQSGISLSYYFNKLDSLLKEFDGLTSLNECTCEDSIKLKYYSNIMKIMQFLSGLVDSYNQVKNHILLMEPLPNVKTTFSMLSKEESLQRNNYLSSLQSSQPSSKSQSTAFSSRFKNRFNSNNSNKNKNQIVQCKNFGIKGHLIEKCHKLLGYPKDFKPRGESNNHNNLNKNILLILLPLLLGVLRLPFLSESVRDSEFHRLTKDQYIKFLQFINDKQNNEEASASANMEGANQHMIASKSLLHYTVDESKLDLLILNRKVNQAMNAKIKVVSND
ncbi:hypothetical protein Lser_V15G19081 [Lactuca serriola]